MTKKKSQKKQAKPKFNKRTKVLLGLIIIAIIVAIASVAIVVTQSHPTKLTEAYNTCMGELDLETALDNHKISIYFKPDTSKTTLEPMATTMRGNSNVKNVTISTSEEEYEKFLSENSDNSELQSTLEDEELKAILKNSMEAVMLVETYSNGDLSDIKRIINLNKEFQANLSSNHEVSYPTERETTKVELLDDGKTLIMESKNYDEYAYRMNCIYYTLNVPDRIKTAIENTTTSDGVRQSSWDDFNVEWYYRNGATNITIYQK